MKRIISALTILAALSACDALVSPELGPPDNSNAPPGAGPPPDAGPPPGAGPPSGTIPGQSGIFEWISFISEGSVGGYATTEISLIHPNGTGLRNITDTPEVERDYAWSPDGTRLAYRRDFELWVMEADGSGQRSLFEGPWVFGPVFWSPDGALIAFSTREGIYRINPDGTGLRAVIKPEGWESLVSMGWSPDGRWLLFTRDGRTLHAVTRDGGEVRYIAGNPDGSGPSFWRGTWSPDGQHIMAFDGVGGDLWLVSSDGSGAKNATRDPRCAADDPAWSPDGKVVAFFKCRDIWLMSPDGSDLRRLTDEWATEDYGPAWSPDGLQIVFTTREWPSNGRSGIYLINRDGSGLQQLTQAELVDHSPAWRPR